MVNQCHRGRKVRSLLGKTKDTVKETLFCIQEIKVLNILILLKKKTNHIQIYAPVAAKLTTQSEYNSGRRSPPVPRDCTGPDCTIQGGKRRRRTRKRRRKKRTKKKARKRRRKRTRRRGGEPTYHKMPPREKTQKHFQLYKNPKSSQSIENEKKSRKRRVGSGDV